MKYFQNFGTIKWELFGCLSLTWVLVIASLYKGRHYLFINHINIQLTTGVSSLGKVSYVITLAPYFVLTALLAYAAQREVCAVNKLTKISQHHLQGAEEGIKALITPEWGELANLNVSDHCLEV